MRNLSRTLSSAVVGVFLLSASIASAGSSAQILRGNADADGGTVTVTITSDTGVVRTFPVRVAPGESSVVTMRNVSEAINGHPDFAAGPGSFTKIGRASCRERVDVARGSGGL